MNQSAVIGGLKAYHAHKISVLSVTAQGVESSDSTALTVVTEPHRVQIAVPYAVGTHSVELFVQMPADSFYDGITITYQNNQSWSRACKDGTKLTVEKLSPGTQYDFDVFVTSRDARSEGLAPPTHVHAGVVTDSSIELLWDRPEGEGHYYEALCMNCADTVMVQKVVDTRAVFKDVIAGKLCNISVRTEKEFFRDSPAVYLTIRAVPEAPDDLIFIEQEVNSMFVMWTRPPGRVDGYRFRYGLTDHHPLQHQLDLHESSVSIHDLTPGSDYSFDIQSFLGSDFSQTTSKNISTRPAGVCSLFVSDVNVTSATVSWAAAAGGFDFYRVIVRNSSHKWTIDASPHLQEVTVSGLWSGCSYNTTVQRFRNTISGAAATINIHSVPASPEGLRVISVSPRSFSLHWLASPGCEKTYQVQLYPDHGNINITTDTADNNVQAQVSSVTPGTSYTVTVNAVASSGFSSPVSRILVTTIESLPAAPSKPEGERVGSTGILLSWRMPMPLDPSIHSFVIRYKEMCPYPDPSFTEITKSLDIPETLLNTLTPGATYNIKVAAVNKAGVGPFSQSLYYKTAEAPPGLVSNLTAFAEDHTSVIVTWFLPVRINGLITKFAVKVKHARTGQIVRTKELNAEDIMNGALPHCNDAADILSRGTPSPSQTSQLTSAVLPPITLSAVPPASIWSVPISVKIDELRPYTPYVFEVSAFTSDGEGQIASTMVRMPEAAPEDPPQNVVLRNITSKSVSLTWEPPKIITGRFSYVIQLHSSEGLISENSTIDQMFIYTGLTPYTTYYIHVMAKSAGAAGPAAVINITTLAEVHCKVCSYLCVFISMSAPSAVSLLKAEAVDSTSVRLSWRSPIQPNGLITHYRILVLYHDTLVQDITLRGQNLISPLRRNARSLDFTTESVFTLTSHETFSTLGRDFTNTDTEAPSALPLTPSTPHTPPPWLTVTHDRTDASVQTQTDAVTEDLTTEHPPVTPGTDQSSVNISPSHPHRVTRSTGSDSTQQETNPPISAATTVGIEILPATEVSADLSSDQITHVVRRLSPFTEYKFSVSAKNIIGEGPSTEVTVKTNEQVPSSVQNVSYQNLSSTSIRVSWEPPLNPNGKITHYAVYAQNLLTNQELRQMTDTTTAVLTGLDKYSSYKVRVAASTAVGESPLTNEDYIYVVTLEDVPDSPPRGLTIVKTTSSTATLSWSPPEKPNGIIRMYEISYTNGTYSNTVNSTSASATLRYLKPHTHYNVTVRAFTLLGHGEQISETLQMLSGEDVPGSPPYDLSYESIGSSSVNVSWSPPLLANGVILFYNVEYWNATQSLNQTTHMPYIVLSNLRKYAHYRISVQAATQVGMGNHTSEILNITTLEDGECLLCFSQTVPSSPPKFLIARKLSDTEVELSWEAPEEANSEILYYIVRVWNLSTEFVANVTETSVVVSVDGPGQYNASVSSWTRLGDGGLLIYITFSTIESAPSDPPQDVVYTLLTISTVRLSWRPPNEPNGIIQYYTIYYTDNNTEYTERVPGSEHQLLLSDLQAGQDYSVWMSSSTSVGDGGLFSPSLNFTTLEDGQSPHSLRGEAQLCTTFPTDYTSKKIALKLPSGPVHNLSATIYSSTAVVISWDPPLEPNGRVYYQLSLQEAGITHPSINRTVNMTITKTTTDTIYLFTKLRKYFPYIINVTPATSAGSAVNHTTMLHLRTDEDVPSSPPLSGSNKNLSSTSIQVSWFPPVEANGEIIEYAVNLQGPSTSNKNYTSETHLVLSELTPFTPYNLSIAAVTRVGTGPPVVLSLHTDEAGPMSPPRNLTIFNHTANSVWLQWEPSPEPNGVVQLYGFRILELNTDSFRYQNSSDASTQAELGGFKPHNSYEISVCTFTRAGNGDQYSLPVLFTTNESVSDAVGNLSCSGLDWDSVYMEWELPDHPNGEILYYLIRSGDLEDEAHPVVLTHTVAHTLTGLSPHAFYLITVAAVNSAGVGEEANCSAHTPPESVVHKKGVNYVPFNVESFQAVQNCFFFCDVLASQSFLSLHSSLHSQTQKIQHCFLSPSAVPGPSHSLTVTDVTSDSVSVSWQRPVHVPGLLQGYNVEIEQLSRNCERQQQQVESCMEAQILEWVEGETTRATLTSLLKYRQYRIRVVAFTRAGAGEPSEWIYTQTLAGNPDAPPGAISVVPSANGLKIEWDKPSVISGPTSYIIDITALDGSGYNITLVRHSEEIRTVIVGNLSAFTLHSVTITAFTGPLSNARRDGKASEPVLIRTLEDEPKDPPKNVTLTVIPEEVTRVYVTFSPPDEPNGNISAYRVDIYRNGQLDFFINSLSVISNPNNTMTAIIDGLKGGFNYSIRIAAVNGAGFGPSSEVHVTTGVKAPPKPKKTPRAALNSAGVIISTSKTITIEMPECFFTDDHGPIQKVQVIVSEPAVMDYGNLSNWKSVFLHPTAPYLTDDGFLNPECPKNSERMSSSTKTYVIGEDEGCLSEDAETLCNGPLKPKTHYVFKFRATNIRGQFTDSEYSDKVRTADDRLLTRDEQIILGVLLSFFLALFLILIIYGSVKIHRRKKEGGTYSPRQAEIIETKFKLDQLIAVADLELKEEKINRLLSYRKSLKPISKKSFLQHVEDLCANDNAKFQEEFAELPKLLQDLATSDADLPWNRSKNRFTNIKPYNNSRVKLLSEPGMPGSDYINASFVSGYLCPNEFIATQGPLPSTVADFWRMIWETGTKTIVMLTQCFEKGRIRCHQYWPEDNKPVTVFADIIITKLTEDVRPDWTVRALKVERHGSYMIVHHFNYTSWPEHGVPESSSTLVQFVKAVRSNRGHENTTIVVHCSAGVGRTGVFIALDHLIQHLRDHEFVDIYGLVAELRSERMCMVQNLAQYMFLHQSTLDLLSAKGNSQSIWFVNYSALEKMDSLDAMEGDVELEWEETTM
nr:phosphatidylinositol phosphatase PTPRQ [Danio rerio]|eukprot:XP_021323628.1 phosphatidylinositol phosphatase PTPRQ [Danio rerio]